jgi:hypothetical protein
VALSAGLDSPSRSRNPIRVLQRPLEPKFQWTAKIDGKTVTRQVGETEVGRDGEWIGSGRHLRELITQMREVAAKGTELMLHEAAPRK